MTRKDTVIAAALVNAGLLVVLFISALKNEEKVESLAQEKGFVESSSHELVFQSEPKKSMGLDEVEEVLKQYAQKEPMQSIAAQNLTEAPLVPSPLGSETLAAAPLKPAPVLDSSIDYLEVKVKKGDVLEKIAKEHRTTVSEIMRINQLSSSRLKIGQVLKVSPAKNSKPTVPTIKTPLDPTSAKYYTIKAGDNLWTIAVRNHIKVEDLLKLNNMTEDKAKKLKPGDTIRTR